MKDSCRQSLITSVFWGDKYFIGLTDSQRILRLQGPSDTRLPTPPAPPGSRLQSRRRGEWVERADHRLTVPVTSLRLQSWVESSLVPDGVFLEAKTPAGCHPKGLHQHWIAKRSREEREIFEHRSRPALIARTRAKEVTRGIARGADSRLWRLAEGGYGRGRWKRGGRASPPRSDSAQI